MLSMRLARHGAKKRPYYFIVVADGRAPRDGHFIEKLGAYNPMLPRESGDRVKLDVERAKHWIKMGAQPTDRVARFLGELDIIPKRKHVETPKKSSPKAKAQERIKMEAEVAAKAAEAAAAPAPAAE